jgi:hypothetical protein
MKKTITVLLVSILITLGGIAKAQEVISLKLSEAHAIGDELHLDFLLENKEADANFSISFSDIKLYDSQGNIFDVKLIVFGQKTITYGGTEQQCIQGIPMKLKLIFKGAPSKLAVVKALMIKLRRTSDNHEMDLRFNNMAVPTSSNKLVLEAAEDPLFMEVAPNLFARMTGVSKNEKELSMDFIVVNMGSDREMGFSFINTRIIDDLGNSMKLSLIDFAGKTATYGGNAVNMPQDIPMKLSFKFKLIDESAKKIKIFEFTSNGVKFQIHDIDLTSLIQH